MQDFKNLRRVAWIRSELRSEVRPFNGARSPRKGQEEAARQLELSEIEPATSSQPIRQDYQRFNREFWKRVFEEEKLSLEDLTAQRTRVAWRFVRELLRAVDFCAEDPLTEIAQYSRDGQGDPWLVPREAKRSGGLPSPGNGSWQLQRVLEAGPLPILPPPFDPPNDEALTRFVAAIDAANDFLGLDRGTYVDPDLGRHGIAGLNDPNLVRLAFPSRDALLRLEAKLAEESLELITFEGVVVARRKLCTKHGLRTHEAEFLIRLGKLEAKKRASAEPEEERALMILRLEAYIQTARDRMIPREELAGLKQLAIVQGLAKIEPEDAASSFYGIARQITRSDPQLKQIDLTATHKQGDKSSA